MFSRTRHCLFVFFLFAVFLFTGFFNAYGDNESASLGQEDIVIGKLHQAIDRNLREEFENNGLASIGAGFVGSIIGISWAGLETMVSSGGVSLVFVDFTVNALMSGAVLGGLSMVSRVYLKTPFDLLSRPLGWLVYQYAQARDWVLYQETPPALEQKYSEFLDPVAGRLMSVVERVFGVPAHYWTITRMDQGTPNAFATSGYNIAVYHSLFPLAKNQAGMACFLGHEMGHVLARHLGQDLSDFFFLNQKAIASIPFANLIAQNRESQADEIGIYLTALAGYDPSECSRLWSRVSAFAGNRRELVNIFLSKHPTNATRQNALRRYGDTLKEYYSNRPQKLGLGLEYTL